MIDVKEAVKKALDYVSSVIPAEALIDPRLEEVELSENEKTWLITISFIRVTPKQYLHSLASAMQEVTQSDREYKLVTIDAETGKPLSMKIRQLV
jgi:hypothetical protein